MLNNNVNDIFELYSFVIYLYFYSYFYLSISEQSFFKFILFNTICNFFTHHFLKYNVFTFVGHSFWKKNLNTIAMPQLICSIKNIYVNSQIRFFNNNYDYLIIIPSDIFVLYFIKRYYKNEDTKSKNLRYVISILSFITRFIFY
jgi:hypothetical protein